MKQLKKRLSAAFLSLAVLVCTALPVFAADGGDSIHIYNVNDLLALQNLCTLDTATQGKTIYLENDLDLTGSGFTGLPTLRGTFEGNGHTISGLELTDKGSVQGFVRYLEEDGTVQNLTVSGTIAPTGMKETLGGLVGVNRGMVRGCVFTGTVIGDSEAGGIVGRNEATGEVISCTNAAAVTAAAMTGGIAGQNLGSIVQCGNGGSVNTTEIKTGLDADTLMSLDTNRLSDGDTTQLKGTVRDVGGITGRSSGIVQSCTNSGAVGYAHIGYNVGGIVGRQSGYLNGCTNTGTVLGRKDVGGVVGQLEPELTVLYGVDKLETLYSELDTLQSLMAATLTDAQASSSTLSSKMEALTGAAQQAKDSTGALADSLTDWTDKNVAALSSTASGYAKALDQIKTILQNAEAALNRADNASTALDQLLADGRVTADLSAEALASLQAALQDFSSARTQARSALDHAEAALQAALDALGSNDDTQEAWQQLTDAMQDFINAANAMQDAANEIYKILAGLPDDEDQQQYVAQLQEQYAIYQQATAAMQQASAVIRDELESDSTDWRVVEAQAKIYLQQALIAADALQKMQQIVTAMGEAVAPALQDQITILLDEAGKAADAAQRMLDALQTLATELDPSNLPDKFWDEMALAKADMDSASASLSSGADNLAAALETLQKALESAAALPGDIAAVMTPLLQSAKDLRAALSPLQGVLSGISVQPITGITSQDSAVSKNSDALDNSIDTLFQRLSDLNSTASGSSDTLINDFSAINTQFGKVTDAIKDLTSSRYSEESLRQHFEDVSADSTAQENGMVVSAANSGSVEGDTAVGGIIGSMAAELDLDPEDDLTEQGQRNADVKLQISLVVLDSRNTGDVTAKKDNAGGIAGRMDCGYLGRCENYGSITSTGGDYVGGLAGISRASIHDSWARCALSGGDYLGGAAGYGKEVVNCTTMVEITDGESCLGALCGGVTDEDAKLEGNRIVSESLGAVDGVTYAVQVTPTGFEEIAADTAAPAQFAQLQLTFTADGKTVAIIPFRYGEGISELPALPAKDGCVAQWPDMDYSHLTYSQTVDAEYTAYTSALADNDEVPNILVDGNFSKNAVITTETEDVEFTDARGETHTGTAVTVTVSDPVFGAPACTVHYRKPDTSAHYTTFVRSADGTWNEVAHEKDGSYLLLPAENGTLTFMVEQTEMNWTLFAVGMTAAAALLVLAGVMLWRARKKGGKRK